MPCGNVHLLFWPQHVKHIRWKLNPMLCTEPEPGPEPADMGLDMVPYDAGQLNMGPVDPHMDLYDPGHPGSDHMISSDRSAGLGPLGSVGGSGPSSAALGSQRSVPMMERRAALPVF